MTVTSVFDESNMLVRYNYNGRMLAGLDNTGFPTQDSSVDLWIRGLPTQGVVDDMDLDADGVMFYVTGTKTYRTVRGNDKTVFLVDAFKESEIGTPSSK